MRRQRLAAHSDGAGVDQDEGKDRRAWPGRNPGVHRAALDADIARLHAHGLAVVELEVALARQQDRVIERLGAVHEFLPACGELDAPPAIALPSPPIIL